MSTEPTLRRLEALVYRYPVARPVATSFGVMHDRPALFVRAEDSDGCIGWGEVWCNFPSVGAEHRARLIEQVLAPWIVGQPCAAPREVFATLSKRSAVLALQCGEIGPFAQAIAGIDIALWDLAGQRAGQALWRMLGGVSPTVDVYASGINPGEAESMVQCQHALGHRAFKLKIGFGRDIDLASLAAVRGWFGGATTLCADANQAWSLDQALAFVPALEPFALDWLEEPLRADRPQQEWQRLAQVTTIPLAGGENIAGAEAFNRTIRSGAVAVIQPDLAKWGGFSGCMPVAHAALNTGRRFCPHYLGGGIGLLASAHLLAAVGGDGRLEVDSNPNPLRDALCGAVSRVTDGRITLDEAPGLGIAPDLARFESLRSRH